MDVTSNSLRVLLHDTINEIVQMREDQIRAVDTRKGLIKEMKAKKLPTAQLLKLATAGPVDQKKVEELKLASALLGIPVAVDAVVADVPVDADLAAFTKEKISVIRSIDEEIDGYKEKIKEKYAAAKAASLTPNIIQQIVEFKIDPTKKTKYEERSSLLDKYLEVLG